MPKASKPDFVTCKYCDEPDLTWKQSPYGDRTLRDSNQKLHVCPQYDRERKKAVRENLLAREHQKSQVDKYRDDNGYI